MTKRQLLRIKAFSKDFYTKTDQFHGWQHIEAVQNNAMLLASNYPVDKRIVTAACYLHDIGRSLKDKGHEKESGRLARPFLLKIGLDDREVGAVIHAVVSHSRSTVKKAKTGEAKLLFDADKLEMMSVYGFLRACCFLVEARKMELKEAIHFMWDYVVDVQNNYLQTREARRIVNRQIKLVRDIVRSVDAWLNRNNDSKLHEK